MTCQDDPTMERIEDPGDPRLDPFRAIRVTERAVRRDGLVLVESPQPVRRALMSGRAVVALAVTPATLPLLDGVVPSSAYLVEQDVLDRAVGFNLHRGVLALVHAPRVRTTAEVLADALPAPVLVLEGLNDAENLGVLFRSAAGLGAGGVLLCPRCADPLSRRSTRVSIGTTLDVPFARLDPWPGALAAVPAAGYELVALTPAAGDALDPTPDPGPVALMLGAEGPGLSAGARNAATRAVGIPMAGGVDSLNVATAAAIALFAHRR
jgi:tRNA G18 (ribose-2'-O)-methylase SpoU